MDAWKDLYYDCISCDKNLREQIKVHEKAIKRLQKEAKITIDGVYGNNTASALQKRL